MIKKYCIFIFSLVIFLRTSGYIQASQIPVAHKANPLESVTSLEEDLYYKACVKFETQNLVLTAISSADQDTKCYHAIYQDSGWQNSWFSGSSVSPFSDERNTPEGIKYILEDLGCDPIFESQHDLIQEKGIELFKKKEKEGGYNKPTSFPNYVIEDKETKNIVGKFIFMDIEKKTERVESGIYILRNFREKKFSSEILKGILTHVIDPALGKAFIFALKKYPKFKGMYAKIAPWYNYPSLKAYSNVGCVLRWDSAPKVFYPTGEEKYLNSSDKGLESFLEIIKIFYNFSKKLKLNKYLPLYCRDVKELFDGIKKYKNNDFKESVCCILANLSLVTEQDTANFAKEALAILEEEGKTQEDSPESLKRYRPEYS